MAEQEMFALYNQRILALSAAIPLTERLTAPDASVMKRSPLCGSSITVDVETESGKITAFGQDVKACVLGQSSAALLAEHVIGQNAESLTKLQSELRAMLKDKGPVPTAPFQGFEVLQTAQDYPNRHASIMLAVDATLEALMQASEKDF